MSLKFNKNRSVDLLYCKIPLKYTGIIHPNKELVLMDSLGSYYSAAWRNNKRNTIGIEFLLKKIPCGFIFKDKKYKHNGSGWVW